MEDDFDPSVVVANRYIVHVNTAEQQVCSVDYLQLGPIDPINTTTIVLATNLVANLHIAYTEGTINKGFHFGNVRAKTLYNQLANVADPIVPVEYPAPIDPLDAAITKLQTQVSLS